MKNIILKRNHKGFTMIELVVSMTISIIVMGIVASMLLIVKNNMDITSLSANRVSEYTNVEQFINNWFYCYDSTDYVLIEPLDDDPSVNIIEFKLKSNEAFKFSLKYDRTEKIISASSSTGTSQLRVYFIDNILISKNGSLIKVTLAYQDNYYDLTFNYFSEE